VRKIPVLKPRQPTADEIVPYLRRIDATRIYSNWGPLVLELRARLSRLLGAPVVCAASGTSALIGAILARARRAGGERGVALVPGFTFPATALAAEACGYAVRFVDVDENTWALAPAALLARGDLRGVGLVVPVAPIGRPVAQESWIEFEKVSGIPVVIDGAASFDGCVRDPGSFVGPIPTVFSFNATKVFGTSEGGAVACADEDLCRRIVRALNYGFDGARNSEAPAINGKMSESTAAIGHAELDAWDGKLAAFAAVATRYRASATRFAWADDLILAPDISAAYAILRRPSSRAAAAVRSTLKARGIETRLWYERDVGRHILYAGADREENPVSERLGGSLVGLPMAPDLADADVERIVGAIASAPPFSSLDLAAMAVAS
jgi:dTDP-4-amino-4,6-dideoxygalactose transaminase